MGAEQFDLAAIGVDDSGHAPFLVGQRALAAGALFIHRVGRGLHGLLHDRPLQFQGGLANVLLDEAQALFGMLLDAVQTRLEILTPAGDVLFQKAVLSLGDYFIDKGVNRFGSRASLREMNSHEVDCGLGCFQPWSNGGENSGARARHRRP